MVTAPTEHWTKIVLNPGPPNLRSKGRLSLCLWLAASTTVIPGWLPKVRAAPLPLHRSSQAPCELPPTRSRRPNSQRRPIVPHAHCSSAGSCRRSTPANLLPVWSKKRAAIERAEGIVVTLSYGRAFRQNAASMLPGKRQTTGPGHLAAEREEFALDCWSTPGRALALVWGLASRSALCRFAVIILQQSA